MQKVYLLLTLGLAFLWVTPAPAGAKPRALAPGQRAAGAARRAVRRRSRSGADSGRCRTCSLPSSRWC